MITYSDNLEITDDIVKKLYQHEKLSERFRTKHKRNWLSQRESEVIDIVSGIKVDNNFRSAVEKYSFIKEKPLSYFMYISNENKGITWMGDVLTGQVYFGKEYRDNFGGKRIPISFTGINGVKYHGTYYKSAGDYCIVKEIGRASCRERV